MMFLGSNPVYFRSWPRDDLKLLEERQRDAAVKAWQENDVPTASRLARERAVSLNVLARRQEQRYAAAVRAHSPTTVSRWTSLRQQPESTVDAASPEVAQALKDMHEAQTAKTTWVGEMKAAPALYMQVLLDDAKKHHDEALAAQVQRDGNAFKYHKKKAQESLTYCIQYLTSCKTPLIESQEDKKLRLETVTGVLEAYKKELAW